MAAETEGLGKAGPDESQFDKIRIHMKYVLDTNTLIYFFKGEGRVAQHLLAIPPKEAQASRNSAFSVQAVSVPHLQ